MKTLVISLLAMGSVLSTFAQDDVLYETKVPKEKIPNIVIGPVKEQLPNLVYQEFDATPAKQVQNKIVLNNSNLGEYDTYQITISGKNKQIINTYDKKGNLIDTHEVAKNERLPEEVATSIAEAYPGWAIHKDVYRMNRFADSREDQSYRVTLEKGNKKMNVYLDATGGILNNQENVVQKTL